MENKKQITLWDLISDVNYEKVGLLNESTLPVYDTFMVNKSLSQTIDTLYYAQELNQYSRISKEAHYKYLLCALPKKKRWSKWIKKNKIPEIDLIIEYYGCSVPKAKEILKMISKDDIEYIISYLDKGGKAKK